MDRVRSHQAWRTESVNAFSQVSKWKKYSAFAIHTTKCMRTWEAEGREKNKVYWIKNSTILFITCQDDDDIPQNFYSSHRAVKTRQFVLKIKENDDRSTLVEKQDQAIKDPKKRIKEKMKKTSWYKARFRKITVLQRIDRKKRDERMKVNRVRKRDKVRKSFFLPISSFQTNR